MIIDQVLTDVSKGLHTIARAGNPSMSGSPQCWGYSEVIDRGSIQGKGLAGASWSLSDVGTELDLA